eukprot:Protomagalhaensia_sp_Gyna_25__156@NODE_1074_length_2222_cov_33_773248_g333_i1_p2_GENE_NODE_1074_length_2222_cov_33_773248_g333_i1NODE_1074_length_2222_cov_33_773248_g333_i1_p2_ORF_typecomplete_len173_score16_15Hydrolase_4/PF12146_8/8_8e09Abhydrolase_1/PF00561_20/0_0029Abhydrolase_6/PF12697_7/0_064_NODE_1074_length_2222_cov_33_773248_g333_i1131649
MSIVLFCKKKLMGVDLPFDGDPLSWAFASPAQPSELVYHCLWPASGFVRGAWILIHGLRGFSRYSWLLKEPRVTDGRAKTSMKKVVAGLASGLPEKATEEDRDTQPMYKGSWVHALNHLGFDVHALDLRGHGLSGGRFGAFDGIDSHVKDVSHFIWDIVVPRYSAGIDTLMG